MSADPESLPRQWREAFDRDASGARPPLADPLPERKLARLLGAFIAAGLAFLVLPGTLLGVWNLIAISSHRQMEATSAAWIQAHGHAQLLGWVGTFIIGISLYTVPKFRGATLRSLPIGWAMFVMWTVAVAARWVSGVQAWNWQALLPASAVVEFAVALLLIWQCSAAGPSRRRGEVWEPFVFFGYAGFAFTLGYQMLLLCRTLPAPMIPASEDRTLISLALWVFCVPVVFGFSARFLPSFLGLAPPGRVPALVSIGCSFLAAVFYVMDGPTAAAVLTLAGAVSGSWSLRVFHPAERPAKTIGVDPLYPWFVRFAYAWLLIAALLGLWAALPGVLGASRHAFTVGFLATMIFAIGPRILPSFLNSRELWSKTLMRASLLLLTVGCALRVSSEPLAYAGIVAAAWWTLPVSALIELTAVVLFAVNIGKTLATPVPSWFGREQVRDSMSLYWYVASYPATRQLLIDCGMATLAKSRTVPVSLTLREAAQADGVDLELAMRRLGDFFDSRLAPSARRRIERKPNPD